MQQNLTAVIDELPDGALARADSGRLFTIAGAVALIVVTLVALVSQRWASIHALANARGSAAEVARTHASLLASELQKYRLLPLVLTEYPDIRLALEDPRPEVVDRVNRELELLVARTDAAAIFLVDNAGRRLAASSWRIPDPRSDQGYGDRPYFVQAMRNGTGEFYSMGSISSQPGLFISRRIEVKDGARTRPLGVVAVKVDFTRLEAGWAQQPGPTYVTNQDGVVVITSRPDWRFRTTRAPDPATRAGLEHDLQLTAGALKPLPLKDADGRFVERTGKTERTFAAAESPIPMAGWRLTSLSPLTPAEASAGVAARSTTLATVAVVFMVLAEMFRRRERALVWIAARRALEIEVARRTAELQDANERLVIKSAEREEVERQFRAAREELAQASRLGSIGQITAGVAHEINQPVAAIRTFAENAAKFLSRGDAAKVHENLGTIVDLTTRIGNITAELRSFARRGTPPIAAVPLSAVLDGALLLIGDQLRAAKITLERPRQALGSMIVVADRVRLEQVLINLLQNAIEALKGVPDPRVRISAEAGEQVVILVADNGPGINPAIADDLFTPFTTGKPAGLGLGLGIARDITREFGGELTVAQSPLGGAGFQIVLRRP